MGYPKLALLCAVFSLFSLPAICQTITSQTASTKKPWYESFSIRGYVQVRYNRIAETNKNLKCEQCDRSIGDNGGLFIRRGRIIISGQVNERTFIYIQPDFASATGTTQNIVQLRDAYVDYGFDKKNEFRIRVGQSKVPYGFENMQSSQNRIPLDRNDALNSALSNERDLAAFFYWAPEKTRKQFSHFVNDGLKGSGDYGVLGFGVFNGQTANRLEANNKLHVVARASYPISIGNQIIEPGIQAYTGKVVIPTENRTANVKAADNFEFRDSRLAGTFVLYPQPFGILAEYTVGEGPEYKPGTDSITTQKLWGGYATLYYQLKTKKLGNILPFTRLQAYNGGKKHELDARSYRVREMETGVEWQINKNFELTTSYVISNRRFEDFRLKNNTQHGNFMRIQVQLNY
jgi:hypothetical protein